MQGEPLVVITGRRQSSRRLKGHPSQGSYLSKDQEAYFFANQEVADNYGSNVQLPTFLNIRNPYTVDVESEIRELTYDYDSLDETKAIIR